MNSIEEINNFNNLINNMDKNDTSVSSFIKENPIIQIILSGYSHSLKEGKKGELGKILAHGNEIFQQQQISRKLHLPVTTTSEAGFDLTILDKAKNTINSKMRGTSSWYLEQTRRHGGKNAGTQSNTGQVCPKVSETDFYCFTDPCGDYLNPLKWKLTLVPSKEVENPSNLGYVRPRVPKGIERKFKKMNMKECYNEYKRK